MEQVVDTLDNLRTELNTNYMVLNQQGKVYQLSKDLFGKEESQECLESIKQTQKRITELKTNIALLEAVKIWK